MTALILSIVAALLTGYGFLVVLLFAATLVRGWIWTRRTQAALDLKPALVEDLADYMAGAEHVPRLKEAAAKQRRVLVEALLEYEGKVSGTSMDRLGKFALDVGIVVDWVTGAHSRIAIERRVAFSGLAFVSAYEPCHRATGNLFHLSTKDPDAAVRLAAARGAAWSTVMDELKDVCEFAISSSLLFRILVAHALRRRAATLSGPIQAALESRDVVQILGALELLLAWDQPMPVEDAGDLLQHADKRIRIAALRLAPLAAASADSQAHVVGMLADADPEVRTAAALSAGKMRIGDALPALARLLRTAPADIARSAAAALAQMPPKGWRTLEELSNNSSPITATAAREALERVQGKPGL